MQTLAELVRMTHSLSPRTLARQDDSLPAGGAPPDTDAAPPELPSERSRFTRWLASFGLGEATIPLLRPLKTPRNTGTR